MALQAVVDPLQRQRLAGEIRRTRILAAAAFGAGECVEPVLPGEVARGANADLHVVLVARLHELLEIDRRHAVGRAGRGGRTSVGSAVTMWKCSPSGSSTRKASTMSICIQYEHVAGVSAPCAARRTPWRARRRRRRSVRSWAMAGSRSARSAKRKPSNAKSVTMIARISDSIEQRLAVALEPRRLQHEAPVERIPTAASTASSTPVLERRE